MRGRTFEGPRLKPKEGLSLEPEEAAGTITIRNVLDESECANLIEAAEAGGMELQTSRGPRFGEAPRRHRRAAYDDPAFARTLWESGLSAAVANLRVGSKKPVGLNPNIRLYAYEPGDVFGRHYDDNNTIGGERTEYTLLVYLSGQAQGMEGGETAFYDSHQRELVRIIPVAGSALLHRHGEACLLHEALAVTRGMKWVLRSDVVFAERE